MLHNTDNELCNSHIYNGYIFTQNPSSTHIIEINLQEWVLIRINTPNYFIILFI